MPKNIVICSDGTGNTDIKGRGTNVFKLYEAVDVNGHRDDPSLIPQVAFYDDGVGTERLRPLKLFGGAFGWGLSRNVKQLYAELVRVHNPKDRIFLFGFSRGAFTVRTLAGFIANCGILDRGEFETDEELREGVKKAYSEYRRKYRTLLGSWLRGRYNPKAMKSSKSGEIEFIGVWDTVDAVGLPFDHLAGFINRFIYCYKFPDSKLNPKVKRACHALAIDDERHSFHPLMWDEKGEAEGRIEQVWFPGVHTNVGGGYPKQGMSLVSLDWMMNRAGKAGLRFVGSERQRYRELQNAQDKLYNSRAGLGIYYRYKPRDIYEICRKYNLEPPKLHLSAVERIMQGTQGYAPGNIPGTAEIVSTKVMPENLNGISQAIRAGLGQDSSLLKRVKLWVFVRRYSHLALTVVSLIGMYLMMSTEISQYGILTALGNLISADGLTGFAKNLLYTPWLPAALIAFYVIGWWASKEMNQVFSKFWKTFNTNSAKSEMVDGFQDIENVTDMVG